MGQWLGGRVPRDTDRSAFARLGHGQRDTDRAAFVGQGQWLKRESLSEVDRAASSGQEQGQRGVGQQLLARGSETQLGFAAPALYSRLPLPASLVSAWGGMGVHEGAWGRMGVNVSVFGLLQHCVCVLQKLLRR